MTNLMEQAREGDPKAIAALMNRSTEPKGISVKASREGNCLQVLLEGETVPARDSTLSFVRQGMQNLDIASIAIVKVFGRQLGQDTPVWQDEIILDEVAALVTAPMGSESDNFDDEELLPDDPLDDVYAENPPHSLDDGAYFDEDDYSENTPSDVPHLPNESITNFVDDEADSYSDDLEDSTLATEDATDSAQTSNPKKSSGLLLGLLTFLALLLGGYYLYSQKPELLASLPVVGEWIPGRGSASGDSAAVGDNIPVATEDPASDAAVTDAAPASETAVPEAADNTAAPEAGTNPETDAAAPEATPAPDVTPEAAAAPEPPPAAAPVPVADSASTESAAADPFREAVNAATRAAEMAQSAQTPAEWAEIVALWETAIAQMGAVPSDSPNYATAQDRLNSYPINLNYARQLAGQ